MDSGAVIFWMITGVLIYATLAWTIRTLRRMLGAFFWVAVIGGLLFGFGVKLYELGVLR